MRLSFIASLILAAAPLFGAEPALQPPVPMAQSGSTAGLPSSTGQLLSRLAAADRALALGLPSVAADLYKPLLEAPAALIGDVAQVRLSCASALMEEGRLAEARTVLDAAVGLRGSAWHLRSGLVSAFSKKPDQARSELAAIRPEELSASDKAWHLFLQGTLADAANNITQGTAFYEQAVKAADAEFSRVRFVLAREQAFLRRGIGNLEVLRSNADTYQGQKVGYGFSRQYAIGLNAAGRKAEAVTVLQRLLQSLPLVERDETDSVRLLLGLIDGTLPGSVGRNALIRLLENGQDLERQRIALALLSAAAARGDAVGEFRAKLDQLIGRQPAYPILENLLLARAQLALGAKDYGQAEADARSLLDRFPGSQLRVHAYAVLTNSSWEQRRFRTAADYAEKARALLSPGPARAQLGLVVAEAWYRATDYRGAADAYGAVLRDLPPGLAPGGIMFQRLQSEVEGDRLDSAQTLLDEFARNKDFDVESRWQAEWNLARALQAADKKAAAYARVSSLLSSPATLPADPSLKARLYWLQARLALEADKPEEAFRLSSSINSVLDGVSPALKAEIASSAALIRAQAQFAAGQPELALSSLQKLRSDFARSDAAVFSIITEADYFLSKDRTVDAQQSLITLADEYKDSPYAPYALYRAALLAERRGQDSNYTEANNLIELLVNRYPQSDLVFYARLKQGDLFRKLNEFAAAERDYDFLVKNYPRHADVLSARIALADCHAAQAGVDPAHADRALELYEGIIARPDAVQDLRVEAGYKLGAAYSRRGDALRATEVWWRDVVADHFEKPDKASSLGARGRYWLARALFDLSALLERQGKIDEARRALRLVTESTLTAASAELARAKISQLGQSTTP